MSDPTPYDCVFTRADRVCPFDCGNEPHHKIELTAACTCKIMNDASRHFKGRPEPSPAHIDPLDVYMVLVVQVSGSVFVKTIDFFRRQGGFRESWGRPWVPIVAESIEDARELGCRLPGARPYTRQAKP